MYKQKGHEMVYKITELADNNVTAWRVLTRLMGIDYGFDYFSMLEKANIRGDLIEVLWYDYAESDINSFAETAEMLDKGVLQKEDVVAHAKAKGLLMEEEEALEQENVPENFESKVR